MCSTFGAQRRLQCELLIEFPVDASVRNLPRSAPGLNDYGLMRKKNEVDVKQICIFIQEIIAGPGSMWGYRSVWHALRIKYKVHVPCKLVATLLRELDPEGVNLRRQHKFSRRRYVSHGPNYCWHIDGKLPPSIHCFSWTKTIWEASPKSTRHVILFTKAGQIRPDQTNSNKHNRACTGHGLPMTRHALHAVAYMQT